MSYCQLCFFFLLLFCSPLLSEEGSFFTSDEWQQIGQQLPTDQDLIVFRDGKKVLGTVESIPLLHFSFGDMLLCVEDVLGISFSETAGQLKTQYITTRGFNLICSYLEKTFAFTERKAILEKSRRSTKNKLSYESIKREYDPKSISFILLHPRKEQVAQHTPFHNIRLKNGDQFPALLSSVPIVLSDGWKEQQLCLTDILSVEFEGGLHGTVLKGGVRRPLSYSFTKDPFVELHAAYQATSMKLPWERMECIFADNGEYYVPKAALSTRINIEDKVALSQIVIQDDEEELQKIAAKPGQADLSKMLYVPAGKFRITSPSGGAQNLLPTAKAPSYLIDLKGYYIDTQFVTNEQYRDFVEATGHKMPSHWARGALPPGFEHHPVVNVTHEDAKAYAAWVGKRLPTEIEWEIASGKFAGTLPDPLLGRFAEWTDTRLGDEATHNFVLRRKVTASEKAPAPRFSLPMSGANTFTGFRCALDER